MPNTLFDDDKPNSILRQIVIGLAISAVIGSWAYASTRASSEDLQKVELELKSVDLEIKLDVKELQDDIHKLEVHQSAFRAQVREALRIPHDPSDP